MKYIHIFVGVFLLLSAGVEGKPHLVNCSIRQGNGTVRINSMAARLDWVLRNPDETAAKVTLQVRPSYGNLDAVFSRDVIVPPNMEVAGNAEMVAMEGTEYLVELLQNGVRIEKETLPVHTSHARYYLTAVLTDKVEKLGFSQIQKNREVSSRIGNVMFNSKNVPSHWGGFYGVSSMILLTPSLSAYSEAQQQALVDYVAQGGTLIIGGAAAAFAMQGTLLETLLPYVPAGTYTTDELAGLAKAFQVKNLKEIPPFDEDGVPTGRPCLTLLNAVLQKDAMELMRLNARTLVSRRYFGRGTVLGLAFNPFELCMANELFIPPVWNMLIVNTRFDSVFKASYDIGYANEALQLMQGYSIPSVSSIVTILLVYIIGAGLILLVMFRLKRHSQGWLLVCLYGVCVTLYVMGRARNITGTTADLSLANLRVSTWDGARGATMNNSLFLSRKDMQPQVTADFEQVLLRTQPQNTSILNRQDSMPSTPTWFKSDGKTSGIEKFTMQQMRPRSITWFEKGRNTLANRGILPEVGYAPSGIRLKDWRLPEELASAKRALLLMPHGQRTLHIADGVVVDSGANSRIEADTLLTSAMRYLASIPVQTTMLALVISTSSNTPLALSASFRGQPANVYDYDIVFVNARIPQGEKPAFIDRNMVNYELPSGSGLRLSLKDGNWMPMQYTGMERASYDVIFHVPEEMAVASPEKVVLNLDVMTTGTGLAFKPVLVACDGTRIDYMEKQGNAFTFYPAGKVVVSPVTSQIYLAIYLKYDGVPTGAMARSNFWQIHDISAEIHNK
ncbi:MAG: hypothetical protein IKP00_08375 [Victivallales bacterium]|nr:hypothetical protein [Victivallales bacterium]